MKSPEGVETKIAHLVGENETIIGFTCIVGAHSACHLFCPDQIILWPSLYLNLELIGQWGSTLPKVRARLPLENYRLRASVQLYIFGIELHYFRNSIFYVQYLYVTSYKADGA